MRPIHIVIFFTLLAFYSCGKKDIKETDPSKPTQTEINPTKESESDVADTLSKEEFFSSTLVQDIAGDENDDLEAYLEDEIYPIVAKSKKVTLEKMSGSLYLLSYDDNGTMKNLLIQEFFNPLEEEVFFEKKEISSDAIKQFVK